MLEKNLNGVQKPSNRALNIGKNTPAPMEGIFRGVRPSCYMKFVCSFSKSKTLFHAIAHRLFVGRNERSKVCVRDYCRSTNEHVELCCQPTVLTVRTLDLKGVLHNVYTIRGQRSSRIIQDQSGQMVLSGH